MFVLDAGSVAGARRSRVRVQAEDAHICEAVQLNIGSRAYLPGPYSPKRESGVRLFHELLGHS